MKPSFRHLADAEILDQAAALFARRGDKTSVQDVADAVGLSKTGLLHHFPSKDALRAAVHAHAEALAADVLGQVAPLPPGAGRDRRAVEVLVDVALRHPGTVALMLAPASEPPAQPPAPPAESPVGAVLEAFGVDPQALDPAAAGPATERAVRVVGATAALAVLTLAAHRAGATTAWRPCIVATCLDALGPAPAAPPDPLRPDPLPDPRTRKA